MDKQACKRSLNCYGKSNVNVINKKSTVMTMEFITKLPRTAKKHDSIMMVVDKLTKSTHFILVKSVHKEDDISDIYM
jgi:hypothetical protein